MAANKGIEYPGKILIIEDDEAQHGLLHDVLEKSIPYLKTDYATTGDAAWKLATDNRYEFICLDWRLGGGVQGLGLLNRFREDDYYRRVPILVISGYLEDKDFALMEEFPFTSALHKPYQGVFLLKKIRNLFQESGWFREKEKELETLFNRQGADPERLSDSLIKMINECPKPVLLAVAGARHIRERGHYKAAVTLLEKVRPLSPDSVAIMSEMGKNKLHLGELPEARNLLVRSYQKSPNNLDRLCDMGKINLQMLDGKAAIQHFDEARAIDPDHKRAKDGINLAVNLETFFTHVNPASIPRTFAGLLNAVGVSLVQGGAVTEGMVHYQSAMEYVDQSLDKAKISFNVGLGHMRSNQTREALDWFQQSVDHYPGYARAQNWVERIGKKLTGGDDDKREHDLDHLVEDLSRPN